MAKAAGKQLLPGPTATAPALDPTTNPIIADLQPSSLCRWGVTGVSILGQNLLKKSLSK
jgi:hypothetical protein